MGYKLKKQKVKEQMDIGKIGEEFFLNYIFPKHFFTHTNCYDIRGTKLEEDIDTDFIISISNDEINIQNLEVQDFIKSELKKHTEESIQTEKYWGIEVKTDNPITRTGNIVYDITSHDKSGGMARSRADFIIYVFIDDSNKIIKYSIINLFKLRRFIRENNKLINKTNNFKSTNFKDKENEKDGNSLLFLINIYFLEKNNIAIIKDVNGTL